MAEEEEKEKSILAGVNYATVIASALAAGTALVLSTRIGIAGSLIGTVVAAAVSSISSQVYQGIINKSADKVKDVAEAALAQTVVVSTSAPEGASDETHVLGLTETDDLTSEDTVVRPRPFEADDEPAIDTDTPIASDTLIQAAHDHESRDVRRRVLVVTIAAALVALALTAVAIYAFTAGQGIGEKPTFTSTAVEEQSADDATTADQGEATDDTTTTEDATQADGAANTAETAEPTEDAQPAATEPSADADTTTDSSTTEPTTDDTSTSDATGDSTDSAEADVTAPAE